MTTVRLRRRIVRPLSNVEPPQPKPTPTISSQQLFDVAAKLAAAEVCLSQLNALPLAYEVHAAMIRAHLARLKVIDELRALIANAK